MRSHTQPICGRAAATGIWRLLDVYYSPWELERAIGRFVAHSNHRRLHESLQSMTPADVYEGRGAAILDRRAQIKRETLRRRKRENLYAV
jgi:putative transposase